MSSPMQYTQVSMKQLDLGGINCAACQSPLQGGKIELNYHRLDRIICPLCGQDYVLCCTCGRLSTFYPTGDWVSCDHCRQGFLHAGSSLIQNMSKEQFEVAERERVLYNKLKQSVREKYKNPVRLILSCEAEKPGANGCAQQTPWWKTLFSRRGHS